MDAFSNCKDHHYAFKRGLMEDVWEIRVFLWFPARKRNQTWKKERIRGKQMNRERRKRVSQAIDLVGKAKEILDDVKSEEQDAYDNLPDSFRNGNRGEEMQGCVEMIEEGWNLLDDAASVMEQI